MEITRVVRGFLGKIKARRERRYRASIKIQCLYRKRKAKKRVVCECIGGCMFRAMFEEYSEGSAIVMFRVEWCIRKPC